jgi:hypothetical protein
MKKIFVFSILLNFTQAYGQDYNNLKVDPYQYEVLPQVSNGIQDNQLTLDPNNTTSPFSYSQNIRVGAQFVAASCSKVFNEMLRVSEIKCDDANTIPHEDDSLTSNSKAGANKPDITNTLIKKFEPAVSYVPEERDLNDIVDTKVAPNTFEGNAVGCVTVGQDSFEQNCNAFQDLLTIGDAQDSQQADIYKLGNNFILSSSAVLGLQSSPQNCEKCLGSIYKSFSGGADKLEEDHKKLKLDIIKQIKDQGIETNIFKLSTSMKNIHQMLGLYERSLDQKISKEYIKKLTCQDPKGLDVALSKQTGCNSASKKESAQNYLIEQMKKFGFNQPQTLENNLEQMHNQVAYIRNVGCNSVLKLSDYQKADSLRNFQLEMNYDSPRLMVYDIIDSNVETFQKICKNSQDKIGASPLEFMGLLARDENNSNQNHTNLREQMLAKFDVYYDYVKQNPSLAGEIGIDSKQLNIPSHMALHKVRIINHALKSDPNLSALLSDWNYLCKSSEKSKDFGNKISAQVVPDQFINSRDGQGFHDYNIARVEEFSETTCSSVYEEIAKFTCLDVNDVVSDDKKFKELLNSIGSRDLKNITAKISDSKGPAQRVALGIMTCSDLNHQGARYPVLSPQSMDSMNHSAFTQRYLNKTYPDRQRHPGFLALEKPEVEVGLFCHDANLNVLSMELERSFYQATFPDEDDRYRAFVSENMDYFKDNRDIISQYGLGGSSQNNLVASNESTNSSSKTTTTTSNAAKNLLSPSQSTNLNNAINQNNYLASNDYNKKRNDRQKKEKNQNDESDEFDDNNFNSLGNSVSNAERLAYEKRIEDLLKRYEALKNAPVSTSNVDKKEREDALKKLENEIQNARNQLKNVAGSEVVNPKKEIGRTVASSSAKADVSDNSSTNLASLGSQLAGISDTNSSLKSAAAGKSSGSSNAISSNGNLYIKVLNKEDINQESIKDFIQNGINADQIETIKVGGEVLMFKLPGQPYININDIDGDLRQQILAKLGIEEANIINDEVKKVEEIKISDKGDDLESILARRAKLEAQLKLFKVEM